MKKVSIYLIIPIALSMLFFFSCTTKRNSENLSNIVLTGTEKGGCFKESNKSKSNGGMPNDTVYFIKKENTITMMVGLRANCCSKLLDRIQIKDNNITAFIEDNGSNPCKCKCYFTYDYTFKLSKPGPTKGMIMFKDYMEQDYKLLLQDSIQ
jgi:hypothetical protein